MPQTDSDTTEAVAAFNRNESERAAYAMAPCALKRIADLLKQDEAEDDLCDLSGDIMPDLVAVLENEDGGYYACAALAAAIWPADTFDPSQDPENMGSIAARAFRIGAIYVQASNQTVPTSANVYAARQLLTAAAIAALELLEGEGRP